MKFEIDAVAAIGLGVLFTTVLVLFASLTILQVNKAAKLRERHEIGNSVATWDFL